MVIMRTLITVLLGLVVVGAALWLWQTHGRQPVA